MSDDKDQWNKRPALQPIPQSHRSSARNPTNKNGMKKQQSKATAVPISTSTNWFRRLVPIENRGVWEPTEPTSESKNWS